ncbi:wall-associated receptor kinase-like 14 [Prunus yedoensis var. nudiflora]|uniref:Wall-associated receptor kinase-like 14 n=1 Tax=Prunus yedoensis var. nudiflora TaxID=2094558 RepID=A0A314V1R3_PRUYE|nr:wall-associated receptor kinase-like 14 [Prunus yedoensis var. nudiflora]
MKIINNPILSFISIFALSVLLANTSHASTPSPCNRSCPGVGTDPIQYPFGFSPGCEIRLKCTPHTGIFIGEFPIQTITPDSIRVTLQSRCNRPLQTLSQLYGPRYAPTSRNAILLQNCTDGQPSSSCEIPNILVKARFDAPPNCSSNSSLSCYAETGKDVQFLDFERVKRRDCKFLLSSISASPPQLLNSSAAPPLFLEVEVVELGWWLEGTCGCHKNANCTTVVSPNGTQGFTCKCNNGLLGDGYVAGSGCWKGSLVCNPAKYLSGQCGGKTRFIVLIGAVFVGASLMISLALICCFIRRQSKLKARHCTKRLLSEATGNCNIPFYPYKEVEKSTNGFSEKQRLGTGAYGTVYAGKLHDEWVAIKRIKHRGNDSIEQVMNEIRLISSVRHQNLVRLLGCSIERGEQILVYEFMANGTLCQHLQRERGDGLSWPIRLTIATQTAQAIAHLHSAVKPPIYHRDIKSSNILLDCNFKAKLADFGLSRLGMAESSHISTAPQGTPGYLDPQYHQNFHLSDKSDVYSFGVVLVEIITGLKAVDFNRPQNEVNLAALANDRIGRGCLNEIIDPFLEPHMDAWTLSSVHKVGELAFRCLAFHRDMRPSMMEVTSELELIKLSRWPSSSEDNTYTASSEGSSCCSSSSVSEKPLKISKSQSERSVILLQSGAAGSLNSTEKLKKDNSPVSVHQDSWLSDQSSPSSNSLLSNAIQ